MTGLNVSRSGDTYHIRYNKYKLHMVIQSDGEMCLFANDSQINIKALEYIIEFAKQIETD